MRRTSLKTRVKEKKENEIMRDYDDDFSRFLQDNSEGKLIVWPDTTQPRVIFVYYDYTINNPHLDKQIKRK